MEAPVAGAKAEGQAIIKLGESLAGLDEASIARVLRWANDHYGVSGKGRNRAIAGALSGTGEVAGNDPQEFPELAALYDAANPTTESEKALVVAYWFQVYRAQPEFDSQTINTELKNLGHGVKNITRALDGLMTQQPRLVHQTRKEGTARQARKKYKVTTEGVKKLKQMLPGSNTE